MRGLFRVSADWASIPSPSQVCVCVCVPWFGAATFTRSRGSHSILVRVATQPWIFASCSRSSETPISQRRGERRLLLMQSSSAHRPLKRRRHHRSSIWLKPFDLEPAWCVWVCARVVGVLPRPSAQFAVFAAGILKGAALLRLLLWGQRDCRLPRRIIGDIAVSRIAENDQRLWPATEQAISEHVEAFHRRLQRAWQQ